MDSEGIPEKSLRLADAPVFSDETEEGYSLLDILLVLVRRRRIIGQTLGLSLVIGLTFAVFSPTEYTATAKVICESATITVHRKVETDPLGITTLLTNVVSIAASLATILFIIASRG